MKTPSAKGGFFMTYKQTLDYLYAQLPMFHRIGPAAYKANLDNTHAIINHLHHPEKEFKSVHIAGTNGKGSVSHMMAAIFISAGYKTGLYTSPHLKDFRERITINGEMIGEQDIISFVEKNKKEFEKIQPSFFEWTVGLAFDYFRNEKVDVAIIETGLGGRLDSTNIITPELSVITGISFDHENLLGDTLEKIAMEKAGIIKENVPVVIGISQKEIERVFRNKAQEKNAPVLFADKNFAGEWLNGPANEFRKIKINNQLFETTLTGDYQKQNIITVLQSMEILKENFKINSENIYSGIKNVVRLTHLRGRWEKLSVNPLTFCDVGHNEEGITEVLKMIAATPHDHLHFVLGMMADKDHRKILSLLPKNATYYFCKPDLPRALDPFELKVKASEFSLSGYTYATVIDAYKAAKKAAAKKDLVFVGGSTFVVAGVI